MTGKSKSDVEVVQELKSFREGIQKSVDEMQSRTGKPTTKDYEILTHMKDNVIMFYLLFRDCFSDKRHLYYVV